MKQQRSNKMLFRSFTVGYSTLLKKMSCMPNSTIYSVQKNILKNVSTLQERSVLSFL